jgi:hypothetical protein
MTFDYAASAELFLPKGKPGARRTTSYRRFRTAAEAIRFAIEEFPAIRTLGAWMRVGDERPCHERTKRIICFFEGRDEAAHHQLSVRLHRR